MSSIIFLIVGFIVATFTLLQVFIILFFGIPTTRKIEKLGYLKKDNKIFRNYLISIIVISAIYLAVLLVVKTFFPNGFVPFLAGIIPMLLFGITKIGKNKDNVTDFTESNKDSFTVHPWEIIKALLPKEAIEHSAKFAQPLVDNLNKNVKEDMDEEHSNKSLPKQ